MQLKTQIGIAAAVASLAIGGGWIHQQTERLYLAQGLVIDKAHDAKWQVRYWESRLDAWDPVEQSNATKQFYRAKRRVRCIEQLYPTALIWEPVEQGYHARGACGEVGAVENDGVVDGKVLQIILERPQSVVGNLRVRGIEIGDLQRAGGDAPISEIMVQPPHVAVR